MTKLDKIETRYGDFNVISNDKVVSESLRLYGEWAQNEICILSRFINKNDVVIDVGAFIGSHSVAFANIAPEGMVYSFEAREEIFNILVENAEKFNNIRAFNFGLGSEKTVLSIENKNSDGEQNLGALNLKEISKSDNQEIINIEKIDDFSFDKVDFMKVDVEGMEYEVLLGAKKIIDQFEPVLFLEINDVHHSVDILNWAKDNTYTIYGVNTDAYNPSNFNCNECNVFGNASETGFLLVKDSQLESNKKNLTDLCLIKTVDDVVLLMLSKQQYPYEVLANEAAAQVLTLNYHSPKIDALCSIHHDEVNQLMLNHKQAIDGLQDEVNQLMLSHKQAIDGFKDEVNKLTLTHKEAVKALEVEVSNNLEVANSYKADLEKYNSLSFLLSKVKEKIWNKVK